MTNHLGPGARPFGWIGSRQNFGYTIALNVEGQLALLQLKNGNPLSVFEIE
jgi:hypothetical protein